MAKDETTPTSQMMPETAAYYATKSIPIAGRDDRAGAVRDSLVGGTYDSAVDIAVIDGDRLAGLVRIETLLAALPQTPLRDLMDNDPPIVAPGTDQEIAAWRAVQRSESSLAVLDADKRFVGLIPPHSLLGVLLHEHDEDLARLGGYLHDTSEAREASLESVLRRFAHRLPWLLVGLAGALLAAGVVGAFQRQLEKDVMIAFFMPGIVYLADAVGTQTETLVIRGLSVGVSIRRIFWREVITGILVGVALALAFIPIGMFGWGDGELAAAVAISIFLASSIATSVAILLPWMFHRLGTDPAYGSGPLATVAQDLLSITVYLLVSTALVT